MKACPPHKTSFYFVSNGTTIFLDIASLLCCHESPDFSPCFYLGGGVGGVNDATNVVT